MSEDRGKILVVDDEYAVRESLHEWFVKDGHEVSTAANAMEALKTLQERPGEWDVVLLDIKMPGMDGMELQRRIHELAPDVVVIMITAYAAVDTAVAALKAGTFDYVTKPFDPDYLSHLLRNALRQRRLVAENAKLRDNLSDMAPRYDLVGESLGSRGMSVAAADRPLDFIREIVRDDLASARYRGVVTRFPPEPNGYLHIGHPKAICLDFGLAAEHGGRCHLRFDDTNPAAEETEYVEAIEADIRWLGFDFGPEPLYASDYFDFMYRAAEYLITAGFAYVDSQSADEMRENRGTFTSPATDSPFRGRSAEENLELFREMREGRHPDGSMVLRAKIDMASGNINMRDPALYRIKRADHHRTGGKWCIYPK